MCGHVSRCMHRLEQQIKICLATRPTGVAFSARGWHSRPPGRPAGPLAFECSETRQGDSDMATVEQHASHTSNGAAQHAADIPVENPATGQIVASVPDLDATAVAEMAARARAAQPNWEAFGFEARGRILRRAQKWLIDNSERVIDTIVSETGKTYEDAELAEIAYAANACGFWAREAPNYLADERVKSAQILLKGKKLILRYRPLGLV